jgi:type IV pilus assembly protein PilM
LKGKQLDWKQRLGLRLGDLLGLDIGSSSVKMVQLSRDAAGYSVTAAAKAFIETDSRNGSPADDIATVRAITQCHRLARVPTKYTVCSVCGPDVAVRYFKFPPLPAEELQSAVALEAEQVCPFSMDDGVMDYQIIPNGSDSLRGVLVAATNRAVQQKEKLVKEATLAPVLMDIDGLALLNCLVQCEHDAGDQAMAVLNVGHTYTTLVIAGDNYIPFVRDTNYAGASITTGIIDKTGLTAEQISAVLFGDGGQPQSLVLPSLEAACDPLVEDVTGTLRFYAAQKKTLCVEKIFVCGGFAPAKGFVDILDRRLGAQAVLWNPFDKIPCRAAADCEHMLRKEGPALAVAAGLAMRSV